MKYAAPALLCLALWPSASQAQQMRIQVSTDGVNFASSILANPGGTVQVLITASFLGDPSTVAGFGSANFQPTVSNWSADDTLLPLRQGGNTNPADGSGMVQPQFYVGSTHGSGPTVQAGYVPGTYGRVNPMGRVFLAGASALQGFVHNNPDGSGQTYLRIAQASNPNWIGQAGNTSGGSGIVSSQLYLVGRTTADPSFWGNREVTLTDPPIHDPALDYRLTNVELFRFAFTLGATAPFNTMVVDAPIAGQQMDGTGLRYMGFYSNTSEVNPSIRLPLTVIPAFINIPAPSTVALLALLPFARRRRRDL